MKKRIFSGAVKIVGLFFLWSASIAQAESLSDEVSYYQKIFPLQDTSTKLVDNEGSGDASLYGTRNFRVVLNGIQYRGGANNYYLKPVARPNMNPLPDVGLENLCKVGFKSAIYLYPNHFSSAPKTVTCKTVAGESNTLHYEQITATASDSPRTILEMIYQAIQTPAQAPIYTHCWNGWHASGLISALALRQFCNMNANEAVNYWVKNTDGQGDGTEFDVIRKEIADFVPFTDLVISESQRQLICR